MVLKKAILTHDMEVMGKMDPFVKVEIGKTKKWSSKVVLKGGTKPDFKSQTKLFDIEQSDNPKITFSVYDKETLGNDDFVGSGVFDLKNLKKYKDKTFEGDIDLNWFDKSGKK